MKSALRYAVCAALLSGCGSKNAHYDKASETALKDSLTAAFNNMAAMNFEGMKVTADVPELVVYDFDAANKPFTALGAAEWNRMMDEYSAASKSGAKMETILRTAECHAVSDFGYCTAEFDQTMTKAGKKSGPFMFRGTLVSKKMGGHWQWVHWHASFRQLPVPPKVVKKPAARTPARTTKTPVKKRTTSTTRKR